MTQIPRSCSGRKQKSPKILCLPLKRKALAHTRATFEEERREVERE
jgi:hypothetical protein